MTKYEVIKFTVETKDGRDPIGKYVNQTDQDRDVVKAFEDKEEALAFFDEQIPYVDDRHGYYLHVCYAVEVNEYDEDGEWIGGGDWWTSCCEEYGLSVKELAERAGVGETIVYRRAKELGRLPSLYEMKHRRPIGRPRKYV